MTSVRLQAGAEQGRDLQRKGLPPGGVRYLAGPGKAVVHSLNAVELWDIASGTLERKLEIPDGCRSTAAWSLTSGRDRLVVAADDGALRILDLDGETVVICGIPSDAESFLRSETPGLATFTGTIYPDGSREDRGRRHPAYTRVCGLSASVDGRLLAAYGQAYALLWDADAGTLRSLLGSWPGHDDLDRIYRVALSPDGRLAATVHVGSGLHLWDATEARHLLHFPLRHSPHESVHRPRDMPVATGGLDGMGPVVFSPDSRMVAAADGPEIRRWETTTGRELVPWRGFGVSHPILGEYRGVPRIHDIRFSSDGRRVLTVGVDATLRVREWSTGEQLWAARPDPCCFDWADLLPDGTQVVWVGCPGLRVFDLPA